MEKYNLCFVVQFVRTCYIQGYKHLLDVRHYVNVYLRNLIPGLKYTIWCNMGKGN